MRQEVYKIIKELGGQATYKQIKQKAKEKFPTLSLFQYIGDRLRKLEKNGYVTHFVNKEGETVWKIIQSYR